MNQAIETEQFLVGLAEESERSVNRLDSVTTSVLIVGSLAYIGSLIAGHSEIIIPASIAAASAYVAGDIFDVITTVRTTQVLKQLDSLGVNHGFREVNPLLPDEPEEKDLLGGKHLLAVSIGLVVSVIFPPIGIAIGLDHINAAFHNKMIKRQLERQFVS